MTLPLYLIAHLIYGMVMAHLFLPRLRVEGEVVGMPLVITLAPVGLLTAPLGAVLLRYAGGWFLHGLLTGDGNVIYERFHLGLMFLTSTLALVATVGGMFFAVAVLARDKNKLLRIPVGVSLLVLIVTLIFDARGVLFVRGADGRFVLFHPAGLVSLGIVAVLAAAFFYARAKHKNPPSPLAI